MGSTQSTWAHRLCANGGRSLPSRHGTDRPRLFRCASRISDGWVPQDGFATRTGTQLGKRGSAVFCFVMITPLLVAISALSLCGFQLASPIEMPMGEFAKTPEGVYAAQ